MMMEKINFSKCYESAVSVMSEASNFKEPINEDIGDWLYRKIIDKKNELFPKGVKGKFFNRQAKILSYIRDGEYDNAVELCKENNVNDGTLFDQNKVFGKRYWKIPFGIIGIAAAVEEFDTLEEMVKAAVNAIQALFIDSGLGSGNTFNLQAEESTKYRDFCSFILTHDGVLADRGGYVATEDVAVMQFFNHLNDFGWSATNIVQSAPGLTRFLIANDFVMALQFLEKIGKFQPSVNLIERYGIPNTFKVYQYLSTSSVKEFTLHEPDVIRDQRNPTIITGGTLADKARNMGYDITKNDGTPQTVRFDTILWLRQEIAIILNRYRNNGEKFNTKDINLFGSNNVKQTLNSLKSSMDDWHNNYCIKTKDSSGRTTYVLNPKYDWKSPEAEEIKRQYASVVQQQFEKLESDINASLKQFNLPPINLQLNFTDWVKNPLQYSQQFLHWIKVFNAPKVI